MENKNKNLNNQVNQNNNGNNKVLIVAMALIIVGLVGYIVYTKFIQKSDNSGFKTDSTQEQDRKNSNGNNETDNSSNNKQQTNDSQITKLERYELSKNDREFTIGNKKIKIKATNNNVYVDNKVATYYGVNASVYITNKFILIVDSAQIDSYPKAVNENGQIIDVTGIKSTPSRLIENLRIDNGKLIATRSNETNVEAGSTVVEFVYEGNQIVVNEIY